MKPKAIFRILLLASFVMTAVATVVFRRLLFDDNLHTVIPGQVYRSGQMDARELGETIEKLGIKTVVNLRGSEWDDWYEAETRLCRELKVEHVDISLRPAKRPTPDKLIRLCELLADPRRRPLLLHCKAGSDRAGLASALALLVDGRSAEEARGQLSWRFGHAAFTSTGVMDDILEEGIGWLRANQRPASAANLIQWLRSEYVYGLYGADIRFEQTARTVSRGQTLALKIAARNRSNVPWDCTAGQEPGKVTMYVWLYPKGTQYATGTRLASLPFPDRTVAPGETLTLNYAVQVDLAPGDYTLRADMLHIDRAVFSTVSGRPTEQALTVLTADDEVSRPTDRKVLP